MSSELQNPSETIMSEHQKSATKMWSGRFREPLNKQFEEWQRSFPFDWRLLPHEVEASIAHARAIEAAGILTSEELFQMEQGLRAVAKLKNIADNEQAEDIHHFVELELTKQIGDLALNFDAPPPNSMDAPSNLHFALKFTPTIATLGIHISRFAEELTLYST